MPRTYTDEERATAVDSYLTHGATRASELLGIPRRTILDWVQDAGVTAQANTEKTAAARQVAAERVANAWGDFRESEALAAGAAANRMRREALEASEQQDAHLLRARVIAYGIFIDKAELLSGKATSRIEVWAETELDAEIRSLVAQMEDRIREGN
jgi:transposase-like protein